MDLFSVFGDTMPQPIYCKNSDKDVDQNALIAWQARAVELASQEDLPPFSQENLNRSLIEEVVKLSYFSQGPRMAKELLNKKGIHFIILKHLPHTYLDGACFSSPSERPIIGITLRYDRMDNFWFTLVHELSHALLHLSEDSQAAFFDDTYRAVLKSESPQEIEANQFARDALISPKEWDRAKADLLTTNRTRMLREFAERLEISPAIVAGRVRWETEDYTKFSKLVGYQKIREQFEDYNRS